MMIRPLILSLSWIATILTPIRSFPDHLQGSVGCATELTTDEVIMNNYILPYSDSRDPAVTIAVLASDERTVLDSPITISKVPITVTMVVQNPNNLRDLQYVMDTTEGATFDRGVCDQKTRVTGRAGDRHTLMIDKIPEKPIQVWAGWACSHEAVTLTNYFVFQKPDNDSMNEKGDSVQELVDQVIDLEEADEHEREVMDPELKDDDAANAGELEEELDQIHANETMRQMMTDLFKNRAKWHEKDIDKRLPHQNVEKYKDLIQEKKIKPHNAHNPNVMQHWDHNWEEVKKQLALQGKLLDGKDEINSKQKEHVRIMERRKERMMKENPIAMDHKLKDLKPRMDHWKDRIREKLSMMKGKMKAPLPNDAEPEEGGEEEEEENTIQRRVREIYEEQDSDIVVKEFLVGLLGLLIANWLILQICLWYDKKHKGDRDL
jgi:hypothetical protein